ncbi:hypothetical protein PENSTE_c007G00926 [Penicillium steckii]|uniref:AMP-dependent synthetase/ligase domain-containing protein n=1 Tax=Penicillium steckii TaxID=303698 RepID=A0A1V6TEV1_9EURO|nr:hypothetical protein PENSTE_c007G00926 [Penicillium steckii]
MTKMAPGLVESNLYIHSTFNQIDTPKNALPLGSIQDWSLGQEPLTSSSATDLTFLKAAWILTLRCFEPEDMINLNYDKGTTTQSEFSATYTVRVDPDWDVASLLKVLQPQENGKLTSSESQFAHSRSICNAELRYVTNPSVTLSSEPFLGERLELVVLENNGQLNAMVNRPGNVPKQLKDSMLWTFQYVLRQILACPTNLKIADIDYCSEHHKRIIKSLTNDVSLPNPNCLHDLIVQNCHRHPKRLAVKSFDGDLTYEELNDLSLRLAHHLVCLDVRPETFVLSSFQKSTWAIVARLAILRAGGAYISIHSSNPPAYLDSVVQRTRAKVMLSDPFFADRFHNTIETVVVVTREWLETLPAPPSPISLPIVQPSNACTVLFTSGSTGKPKAIVQEHKSYAFAIRDYIRNFHLDDQTRYLHYDDYAFDISNIEFLAPLISGGCCCVPGPMKTVQDLADNINILDVNIAFLTPTVAIKANPDAMKNLKTLCLGGEPLTRDLLHRWAGSSTKVINQYGMGELAVCCAYNDNVYEPSSSPTTIGRSSSGAIWIINPLCPDKLMPIGAVGEIVIEGPHLSRGYLDQDHEVADRTKPAGMMKQIPKWLSEIHPNRQLPRLYRSGDLGRWTHNGSIEYIGRKDTIVKLDGCRIDVNEVEHLARNSLTSKDAIIVDLLGVVDGKEDPCLAAFLYLSDHPDNSATNEVSLKDASLDQISSQKVRQIKEVLAISLPTYMIPTRFLLATKVPRTPSKKTDRRMIRLLSSKFYAQERENCDRPFLQPGDAQLLPP